MKVGWTASRGPWWSWVVLAAIVAVRAFAYERGYQWLETATVVPAVASPDVHPGRSAAVATGLASGVFLVFMLNLPPAINDMVAMPLQRIATIGSVFVMQLTGLWVVTRATSSSSARRSRRQTITSCWKSHWRATACRC